MTNDHSTRWARISVALARPRSGQNNGTEPHSRYAPNP